MKVLIKVKFFAHICDQVGTREIKLAVEKDIYRAIDQIELEIGHPIAKKLDKEVGLLINGIAYRHYIKNKTYLQDGDVLAFVPILGAG